MAIDEQTLAPRGPERVLAPQPPTEGADGRYSQTWYPVCLSSDVSPGSIHGAEFLGGRVIVFRDADGRAQVLSAYCVHLGADLSVGEVVDDEIRCRFHHWRYDAGGRCVATGIGDPVPEQAQLYRFPTVERYGVIWAFNGDDPLFDLPRLPYPEDRLVWQPFVLPETLEADPWVIAAQTLDLQHFSLQHDFELLEEPRDSLEETDHSMGYRLKVKMDDGPLYDARVDVYGTNIFWQTGTLDGRWFFWITGVGLPRPGLSRATFVYGTLRQPDDGAEGTYRFMQLALGTMMGMLADDADVLRTIRYRPGLLTESDDALSRFVEYLRAYPRAHPSAEFIR